MAVPNRGDVLIRHCADSDFELTDPVTRQLIGSTPTLVEALHLASSGGGAVWRQNIDNRGRALGDPILLLPRRSVGAR